MNEAVRARAETERFDKWIRQQFLGNLDATNTMRCASFVYAFEGGFRLCFVLAVGVVGTANGLAADFDVAPYLPTSCDVAGTGTNGE